LCDGQEPDRTLGTPAVDPRSSSTCEDFPLTIANTEHGIV